MKNKKILAAGFIIVIVLIIAIIFYFFAGKGTVTQKEVSSLPDRFTTEQLKEELGEPLKVVEGKEESLQVLNNLDSSDYIGEEQEYKFAKIELEASNNDAVYYYKNSSTGDYYKFFFTDDICSFYVYDLK
ncbi:hypothetical protein [Listeria ilorinensis]|uniref:hypothetical protein n=1 Tax=Listeria ilorinensis TaxID=2867439 RepID=UPI001EF736BC|nr:hypothetical protein [Listeria ilorinensis]